VATYSLAARSDADADVEAERQTIDLAETLLRDFRDRDELYGEINRVMFNDYAVEIPEAYKKTALEVHTPLPLEIVNQAAAALSVNPVSVMFRPVGFGDVHMQNATAREHFFEASWERQQNEARRRLLRVFMYALVSKGEGVLKTTERRRTAWTAYYEGAKQIADELEHGTYDDDARDRMYNERTEELKLLQPYPITTTDVPPETFYYTKNENGFTSCVELKQMPYYECLQRWGARLDRDGHVYLPTEEQDVDPRALGLARPDEGWGSGSKTERTVLCVEAWDWQWQRIVLIGPGDQRSFSGGLGKGTLVRQRRHRYGDKLLKTLRGPYFHALGVTTDSRMPSRSGLSVLFGYLRLFPLLNSMLTIQSNAAFMYGFPAFKRTLPTGAIPGIPESAADYGKSASDTGGGGEPIIPGEIYPFDVAAIDMPRAGSDAEKLIANIQTMLERAMPDVVKGTVSGDQSGYAINQAAHLARLAWDPIVSNAQAALGERTNFESWLIEACIREKVYAWGEQRQKGKSKRGPTKAGWLGIGPEELKGIHRYEIRLDPETPSNRVIETRAIIEQMNARLITYEDAVTEMGSNPDEVELSWMAQDYKKSPEIQALVMRMVTEKVATVTARKIAALGVDQAAMAGTPPGMPMPNLNMAGAPPPNPVPMPGAGMPLAPPPPGGGMCMAWPACTAGAFFIAGFSSPFSSLGLCPWSWSCFINALHEKLSIQTKNEPDRQKNVCTITNTLSQAQLNHLEARFVPGIFRPRP